MKRLILAVTLGASALMITACATPTPAPAGPTAISRTAGTAILDAQEAYLAQDYSEAVDITRKALVSPSLSDYEQGLLYSIQGASLFSLDKNKEAIAALREASIATKDIDAISHKTNLGAIYKLEIKEKNFAIALSAYDEWVAAEGEPTWVDLMTASYAAFEVGDADSAVALLDKALLLDLTDKDRERQEQIRAAYLQGETPFIPEASPDWLSLKIKPQEP